jgi:hypothetical protein
VEFLADPDGDLAPGAVLITSELLLPVSPELGVGSRTKRIATVYSGTGPQTREVRTIDVRPSDLRPTEVRPTEVRATEVRASEAVTSDVRTIELPAPSPAPVTLPPLPVATQRALARLSYQDEAGAHEYAVIKASVSIGRGGLTYPVDIRIVSSPDVSREHARIRHDADTGRFCLIDLSTLGTTLDGQALPRGYDEVDGTKRENGVEVPLPERCRIGLANTVFLDFRIER